MKSLTCDQCETTAPVDSTHRWLKFERGLEVDQYRSVYHFCSWDCAVAYGKKEINRLKAWQREEKRRAKQ